MVNYHILTVKEVFTGSSSQESWIVGSSPTRGHDHHSSYDSVMAGFRKWTQKEIYLCCGNLFHYQVKIFKLSFSCDGVIFSNILFLTRHVSLKHMCRLFRRHKNQRSISVVIAIFNCIWRILFHKLDSFYLAVIRRPSSWKASRNICCSYSSKLIFSTFISVLLSQAR